MKTRPFCQSGLENARILVIGHDPRLQESDNQAEYALYANLFFQGLSSRPGDKAKRALAAKLYDCIMHVTSNGYSETDILVTNLCNNFLPPAPKGKTVYIPRDEAREGIEEINYLLSNSDIRMIFAMSEQVNYWLQVLNFCTKSEEFLREAEPNASAVHSKLPFYAPSKSGAFRKICGIRHKVREGGTPLYPIVHVKNWPLVNRFTVYTVCYQKMKDDIKAISILS